MSIRGELLRLGTRSMLKSRRRNLDIDLWRKKMTAMERLVPRPPSRMRSDEVRFAALTFHRVVAPTSHPRRHVLYLHGGGYVSGGPQHYRHFTWRVAEALCASVWTLAYRLAPEHPFPAALDDALAGYTFVAGSVPGGSRLFVMGDSAGGGLALALLLRLRDTRGSLPQAAIALSPWTDLALTGASITSNAAADPILNAGHLPQLAPLYLAGADPRTPYASPLYGDLAGLPPVLIQVGSDEILRDDAVRMADKLRQHNPQSRIEIWRRMPHGFQLFAPILPEAIGAIAQIADFIAAIDAGERSAAQIAIIPNP